VLGNCGAVGDKKRWGVMRKTNLTQSRKGAKEKRKKAPRHYRFDPTLDKQVAVLKRSGPKVAALSFGSKQIVNGKTLSPRSKDMMRSLICVLDCKTNSYSEK
jgi:hypothetical protein